MEPGPQFQQLPMFMTAGELRDPGQTVHGDLRGEHPDEMFAQKLDSARWMGLARRVDEYGGVIAPVRMRAGAAGSQTLVNGHHRTAVAYARNPKSLLPVEWDRGQG